MNDHGRDAARVARTEEVRIERLAGGEIEIVRVEEHGVEPPLLRQVRDERAQVEWRRRAAAALAADVDAVDMEGGGCEAVPLARRRAVRVASDGLISDLAGLAGLGHRRASVAGASSVCSFDDAAPQ